MKLNARIETVMVFPRVVVGAMARLKERLQQDYEQTYPGLGEIIRLVLEEEETRAWELSTFPHLFLPDLVEAHIARLGLNRSALRYEFAGPSPMLAAAG